MSTRAYLTLTSGSTILDSAFCPSSAYPSYVGLDVLDAVKQDYFQDYLAQIRSDYPEEKDMLDGIERSWYVKGKDNQDNFFSSYAYEYDIARSQLTVYHYGDKALTITPDNIDLYKFIFKEEESLYYPICLDENTMTLKKDFYKEVRNMVKTGATQEDFQNIIDKNPSVLYVDRGRICDVGGRDYKTNFKKRVCDSKSSIDLMFIANDFSNSGKFSLSVQTPFYRASIQTPPLRSAAAVDKELARLVRERPDDIRGTKLLFSQINAYKEDIRKIFEDEHLTLDERADLARNARLDMMATVNRTKDQFRILGATIDMLNRDVSDVIYREFHRAKAIEEEKEEQKDSIDTLVSGAASRVNLGNTKESTKEKEMESSL